MLDLVWFQNKPHIATCYFYTELIAKVNIDEKPETDRYRSTSNKRYAKIA